MSGPGNRRRRKSSSRYHLERTFEPPKDVTSPPVLLKYPNRDRMDNRELGAIRRPSVATVGGIEMGPIDPSVLPVAEPEANDPHRRTGENWAEFESRLAVMDLERFLQHKTPRSSVQFEKMKEEQRGEIMKKKNTLRKKDMVLPGDDDEVTPPGPPNRRPREDIFRPGDV